MSTRRPLIPFAIISKGLTAPFDLNDGCGCSLPLVARDVDSYFAWSLLCLEASRVLDSALDQLPQPISELLKTFATSFPNEEAPDDLTRDPSGVRLDLRLSTNDYAVWEKLTSDPSFENVLRDLTAQFLLIAEMPHDVVDSEIVLVQATYREALKFDPTLSDKLLEGLGIFPSRFDVPIPRVGWGRSQHVVFDAPESVFITDAFIFQDDPVVEEDSPDRARYERRLSPATAQLHSSMDTARKGSYTAQVHMRVLDEGYFRAVILSALLAYLVQLLGFLNLQRLVNASHTDAEAAVALILVAPSIIAAYLIKPGEHIIASRMLRWPRYSAGVAGILTYGSAGALVLHFSIAQIRIYWLVSVLISGVLTVFTCVAFDLSSRDIATARKEFGKTKTEVAV